MACPYFEPVAKLEDRVWSRPPRFPLGGAYTGVCHAPRSESWRPDAETARELCNVGYARGRCGYFPADAPADAVRFSAAGYTDGVLPVQFILERDYFPVEHGLLEYSAASGSFREPHRGGLLPRQALGFVENHLRGRETA
ncbi:MAG: hypothetical protein ACRD9L_22395 [Bryobacteraceae bacterium]